MLEYCNRLIFLVRLSLDMLWLHVLIWFGPVQDVFLASGNCCLLHPLGCRFRIEASQSGLVLKWACRSETFKVLFGCEIWSCRVNGLSCEGS